MSRLMIQFEDRLKGVI